MSCIQSYIDPEWVQALYKNRTPEQQESIRYLALRGTKALGCLKNLLLSHFAPLLTDNEYDKRMYDLSRVKERALSKLGISIEQVMEIEPVCFQGYNLKDSRLSTEREDMWVGSSYQVTWLFFSESQVYFYQYNFSSIDNEEREYTEEYFYKDVLAFSSNTERTEVNGCTPQGQPRKEIVSQESFQLKTAAGNMECSLKKNDPVAERRIKEMRELLRQKKA